MNRVNLLNALKAFTEDAVSELILPVRVQSANETQTYRAAAVYLMRLPDGTSAMKKAPYIIHQLVTGTDRQRAGEDAEATAQVRSIFAVYNDDEQEGSLALVNLMERVRIALLKAVFLDGRYQLDLDTGIECFVYPDDSNPYYIGEMTTTWQIPAVTREVNFLYEGFQS